MILAYAFDAYIPLRSSRCRGLYRSQNNHLATHCLLSFIRSSDLDSHLITAPMQTPSEPFPTGSEPLPLGGNAYLIDGTRIVEVDILRNRITVESMGRHGQWSGITHEIFFRAETPLLPDRKICPSLFELRNGGSELNWVPKTLTPLDEAGDIPDFGKQIYDHLEGDMDDHVGRQRHRTAFVLRSGVMNQNFEDKNMPIDSLREGDSNAPYLTRSQCRAKGYCRGHDSAHDTDDPSSENDGWIDYSESSYSQHAHAHGHGMTPRGLKGRPPPLDQEGDIAMDDDEMTDGIEMHKAKERRWHMEEA